MSRSSSAAIMFDGGDDALVVVSLIDLHEQNCMMVLDNFNQLKEKMRNYRKQIPFSMKFEEIKQITPPSGDRFQYPSDTKISYNHNCICVADESNRRIVFFNLETFEFIKSFMLTESATCLLIEENYDNQHNDAIYLGEHEITVKYSIKDILEDSDSAVEIWKINKLHTYGMAIRKSINNEKQLFRFNSHETKMDIINPINGEIIGKFKLENVSRILDIIFITPYKMIVSELHTNKCYIFEEENSKSSTNEWKLIKEIDQYNDIGFSQPLGMTIDRVGKRIFLSDYDNKRLITFDYDGNILATFQSSSEMKINPFGLCFDERTGLLYVTDQQYYSIRVFK